MIAPDSNRSATARSITTRSPLSVKEVEFGDGARGFATDGTPVDCVRFADLGLLGERPDLIVSGINHGANLGDDITYSGTVAAALEGIVLGIPAVAISQQSEKREMDFKFGRSFDFELAAGFLAGLVGRLAETGMPEGTLINVNCPAGEPERRRGHPPRQAPLQRRAEAGRRGLRGWAAPLPDLRLRALVRGRGGIRPLGDREGPDLGHPGALRPHRPDRNRSAARLGPRGDARRRRRSGRQGEVSPAAAGEAGRRAAARDRAPQPPLLRPRRPRDRRRRLRRPARRAARARGRAPRAAHPRLADPAGRARSRWSASSRSSTRSRCSRSATRATRRSCAPGRSGCATASTSSTSPPRRRATRPSRRSTAWRSRSPTRTGC